MTEWGWQGHVVGISPLAYWLGLAAVAILTGLALALNAIVLRKAGYHWLWALLFLFPLAYVIGVWVFAWGRWPNSLAPHHQQG